MMFWILALKHAGQGLPTSAKAGLAVSFSVGGAGILGGVTMIGMGRTTYQFVERGHTIGRAGPD